MRHTLVMDLTGESRDTQVQPPLKAWMMFFNVELDDVLPTFTLIDMKDNGATMQRPVVQHDHVMTIEIPSADTTRPAIIRFERMPDGSFRYGVSTSQDAEYVHLDWLLDNIPNPRRGRGRRWLAI